MSPDSSRLCSREKFFFFIGHKLNFLKHKNHGPSYSLSSCDLGDEFGEEL